MLILGHPLHSFISYHQQIFIDLNDHEFYSIIKYSRNYIHSLRKTKYLIFPLIEKRIGGISLRVRKVVLFFGVEKLGSNNIGKLMELIRNKIRLLQGSYVISKRISQN